MTFLQSTPFEKYGDIWVKREDSCVRPDYRPLFPKFSKLRGVYEHLRKKKEEGFEVIGVLDTIHSQAGWGVAATCKFLGLKCVNYYPVRKGEEGLRFNQRKSKELGAELVPFPATKSAVLFHKAKKHLKANYENSYMVANGLKLPESIDENAKEAEKTPKELLKGTWVFSVSTGTIMAGVIKGLSKVSDLRKIKFIAHMGYSRSEKGLLRYLWDASGVYNANIEIVDEGYEYKDSVDFPAPFPCDPYYDRKAWKWVVENRKRLKEPIVFWNVG